MELEETIEKLLNEYYPKGKIKLIKGLISKFYLNQAISIVYAAYTGPIRVLEELEMPEDSHTGSIIITNKRVIGSGIEDPHEKGNIILIYYTLRHNKKPLQVMDIYKILEIPTEEGKKVTKIEFSGRYIPPIGIIRSKSDITPTLMKVLKYHQIADKIIPVKIFREIRENGIIVEYKDYYKVEKTQKNLIPRHHGAYF